MLKQKAHRADRYSILCLHQNDPTERSDAMNLMAHIYFMAITLHCETHSTTPINFLIQKGYVYTWMGSMTLRRNGFFCLCFLLFLNFFFSLYIAYINANDNLCIICRMISLLNQAAIKRLTQRQEWIAANAIFFLLSLCWFRCLFGTLPIISRWLSIARPKILRFTGKSISPSDTRRTVSKIYKIIESHCVYVAAAKKKRRWTLYFHHFVIVCERRAHYSRVWALCKTRSRNSLFII